MSSVIYSHPTHTGIIIGGRSQNLKTIERRYGVYIDITTIQNFKKLDEFNNTIPILNDYKGYSNIIKYLSKIIIWKKSDQVNDPDIQACEKYIRSVIDVSICNLKKQIENYTIYSEKVIECFRLGHKEANRALPCNMCKISHLSCLAGRQCCEMGPSIHTGFRSYRACYTCNTSLR